MRRTPLKRKSYPKPRTRPMRRKRPPVTDDPKYLARVRLLPCAAIGMTLLTPMLRLRTRHECWGRIHAHHTTVARRGTRKSLDRDAIPLCDLAHRQLHALSGPFDDFDKAARRAWERARVAETQAALGVGGEG